MMKRTKMDSIRVPASIASNATMRSYIEERYTEVPLPVLLKELHERFSFFRSPSEPELAVFVEVLQLGGRLPSDTVSGRKSRLGRDPELMRFLRKNLSGRTIAELRSKCVARFPASRVPSMSALGRWVVAERRGVKIKTSKIARDQELMAFAQERIKTTTLHDLRRAMQHRFPDRAIPSRSALSRFAVDIIGPRKPGRRFTIDDDPEVAALVRSLAGRVPIDRIREVCGRAFPAVAMSRSALARVVLHELRSTYGVEDTQTTGAGKDQVNE